jgi:hypothetical protein
LREFYVTWILLSLRNTTDLAHATRFQTYGVNLSGTAKVYHDQILSQPLVSEWLTLGEQEEIIIEQFELEQQK